MAEKKMPGVYRLKLTMIVLAEDLDAAMESVRVPSTVKATAWEQTTIRDTDGWINPAWRVTEANGVTTVEPKRKRRTSR